MGLEGYHTIRSNNLSKGNEIDNMYNIIMWMYDYVNLIADGELNLR
jgi:hypothetical protein